MLRALLYSVKHFLLYRTPRKVSQRTLRRAMQHIKCSTDLQSCQTLITNLMLLGVGLRVATDDARAISRFTYLTPLQRELIALVTPYGFKVGTL